MKIKNLFSGREIYWLVGIFSALVFILIYGGYIINPLYTDWLFMGGDPTQHYLGWVAYRKSAWHFPIGMVDNLAYPHLTSIIFTDSLPLFAVPFKILSPILPENFQYFGLWGIMSYMLQGIFTCRIVKKYTQSKVVIVLSSVLAVLTPVMIWRMFGHTSLAGHWILIYALGLLFLREKYREGNRIYIDIAIIALLSSSVHIYFILMNGIIIAGFCLLDILENKRVVRTLIILAEFIAVSAAVVGLLGGFSSGMEPQNEGLGKYSSNLNTFYNPVGWSSVLRDRAMYGDGQYEGFGYLGIGFILLLFICIVLLVGQIDIKEMFRTHWKLIVSMGAVFITSFLLALSPVITKGDKVLLQINLPVFLTDQLSIFRATGRIIFICVYVIEICAFIILCKGINKNRIIVAVLGVALLLHLYDIHWILQQKHAQFGHVDQYKSPLATTEFWDTLANNKELKHIVYYEKPQKNTYYAITDWALANDKTMSDFYFARSIDDKVKQTKDKAFSEFPEDTFFIFPNYELMNCLRYDLNYYLVDDLIIGYVNEIEGFTPMRTDEFNMQMYFGGSAFLPTESGVDTEKGRVLYPGGVSLGPCWILPKAKYRITLSGTDIPDELEVTVCYGGRKKTPKYKITSRSKTSLTLEVTLNEDVTDLEVPLTNNSDRNAVVQSLFLQCISIG